MCQRFDCSTTPILLHLSFGNLEFSGFCFIQHESRNVEFLDYKHWHKMLWYILKKIKTQEGGNRLVQLKSTGLNSSQGVPKPNKILAPQPGRM
jgi:hypothetical protein